MSDGLSPDIPENYADPNPQHTGKQDDCPFAEVNEHGKFICQRCRDTGMADRTISEDIEITAFLQREIKRLGLEDWQFEWEIGEVPNGHRGAFVATELHRRTALITLDPDYEDDWEFLSRHELVHVLLADLVFAASNGRSVDVMDMIHLFEERVCNAVARALDDEA